MINTKFEIYKLKRELKRSGVKYKFERYGVNDFGEPNQELEEIGFVNGLYHEQNGSIQLSTGDAVQTRTKKIPMILCLYEDVILLNLKVGDFVIINNKTFKLTGIVNVQEWNLICDISLEVVDGGVSI